MAATTDLPVIGTGTVQQVRFRAPDGILLTGTLYLPAQVSATRTVPALLEALPYRKDDMLEHTAEYTRLRDEFGYAVCHLDLRGTGSSEGVATDEYPQTELADLAHVIAHLAASDWCNGRVGMFGTSYSGFNSLQVAAVRPPALKAIVPIYSSDDPYTDDVHYTGGSLNLLDLVDYPIFMAALNALPPVPEVLERGAAAADAAAAAGAAAGSPRARDWRREWVERLDVEPWLLRWLDEQAYGPYWQERAIRPDYARIEVPTMIISGWADGYRNNTFRTFAALQAAGTPCRLVLGPWSHMSAASSLPGPWIDLLAELARWFDRWLKDEPNGIDLENPIQLFARRSTRPGPLVPVVEGSWRSEPEWPLPHGVDLLVPLGTGERRYTVRADVGVSAWNACAGSLPWGAPEDQRFDDAASLTWDIPLERPLEILGHSVLTVDVASSAPVAGLSAKLQDVHPDGSSTLITRGYLNLTHRTGVHAAPRALEPGVFETVVVELDATSWELSAGHSLRLAIAGTDWPNVSAPPAPLELVLRLDGSTLVVPTVPSGSPRAASSVIEIDRMGDAPDTTNITWRHGRDVLRGRTTATVDHGSHWISSNGYPCEDHYSGEVGIDLADFSQRVDARAMFEVTWPEAVVRSEAVLRLRTNAKSIDVEVLVRAWEDDVEVGTRRFARMIPRLLQ